MFLKERIQLDYKYWEGGEIFLEAQTGTGKTSFVLDVLVPYAMEKGKEVLFLSNRFLLKKQIKCKVARKQGLPIEEYELVEEVEEFDGITIMTYQKLQKKCQHLNVLLYAEEIKKRYFYIVYDEAHYILQDATFNPEILYLLVFVKAYCGTEIFLSATMDELTEFLMEWKYEGKIDWDNSINYPHLTLYEIQKKSSIIAGLRYWIWRYKFPEKVRKREIKIFGNLDELLPFINKEDDEKWLIFLGNKSRMEEYKKKIKVPCDLLTADNVKSNETLELINEIRLREQFPKKVLLTTKILDNGINIKDRKVKNVVIDTECKTEFLQMFGRKRIQDENDTFRLFIPKKSKSYFSCLLKMRVEQSLDFLNKSYSTPELLRLLHDKDALRMILNFYTEYKGMLMCNPAGKFKLEMEKNFFEQMIEMMKIDPWAFAKEQMNWLHIAEEFSEENSITVQNYKRSISEIFDFIKEYAGEKLNKNDQTRFRELFAKKLKFNGIVIGKNGRIPGKNAINKFLENNSISYCIKANKISKKGEETIWIIERRDDHVLSC